MFYVVISPNFNVKLIIFSEFWPGAFPQNCWKKPLSDHNKGITKFVLYLSWRYFSLVFSNFLLQLFLTHNSKLEEVAVSSCRNQRTFIKTLNYPRQMTVDVVVDIQTPVGAKLWEVSCYKKVLYSDCPILHTKESLLPISTAITFIIKWA